MNKSIRRLTCVVCSLLALVLAISCGGDDDGGGGSGSGNDDDDDSSGNGGAGSGTPLPPECQPPANDSDCVGTYFEGEVIPLDIYVMFDLSCSMSCSVDRSGCCRDSDNPDPLEEWRIQPVRDAMTTFLQDPASAGIGVGLGFFGDHAIDANTDPVVCSVESHTDATVEIQRLPDAADEIIQELEDGEPQGGTPTHLAIEGACRYVEDWKAQNRAHQVVILLVTDGIPEHSCNATIGLATDAATDCYDDGAGFQTYVLGVSANNNNSLEQLHQIAEAGGTEQAYLTDANDVAGSVLEALNAIRAAAAIPCEMSIPDPPEGETLDLGRINLGICDANHNVVVTPQVESESACEDHDGWYYDDPDSPETIHLCEVTCETVEVPGATLFFSVGCETETLIY
jgi:hypothetical protein